MVDERAWLQGEIRGTIARALCMEDNGPCVTCTGDASDVLIALAESGYLKTDDGVGSQPVPPAGPAVSPPAPSSPRTFELVRHHDVSGQTGTGVVAEGVQFTDGSAALRWRGGHPATAVWPNVEEVLAVHGHQGATELRWLDGA